MDKIIFLNASELLKNLKERECVVEDISSGRIKIIAFDKQRNKTSEAMRSLRKVKDGHQIWICAEKKRFLELLIKEFKEVGKILYRIWARQGVVLNHLLDLESRPLSRGTISSG